MKKLIALVLVFVSIGASAGTWDLIPDTKNCSARYAEIKARQLTLMDERRPLSEDNLAVSAAKKELDELIVIVKAKKFSNKAESDAAFAEVNGVIAMYNDMLTKFKSKVAKHDAGVEKVRLDMAVFDAECHK